MPEVRIQCVFYNYREEDGSPASTAWKGDVITISEEEYERGAAFGAFVGTTSEQVSAVEAALPAPSGDPPQESLEGIMPSELTEEQIDSLAGDALDEMIEAADIDASTGGSLSNGSLSAAEKRAALKKQSTAVNA